jgi:hypothetical protein
MYMKKILLFSTVLLLAGTCAVAQEKATKKQATEAPKAKRVSEAEALKAKRLAEKKAIELQNTQAPAAPKAAKASLVDPRSN